MIFDDLTPPPGGLAGLRVKLERERSPRLLRYALATAAACALFFAWPSAPPPPPSSFFAVAKTPLSLENGSALLVHDDAKVIIYVTASGD